MFIDRLFKHLPFQADRGLENENWLRSGSSEPTGPRTPLGASGEAYVEMRNQDVHTVGRLDPKLGLVVPDHRASIIANQGANRDILRTLWTGHQLQIGREVVLEEKLQGTHAIWAMSLALARELVGFPILAGIAYAENRGHIAAHEARLRDPLTHSVEPVKTRNAKAGLSYKSDAFSWGRGHGADYDYRLHFKDETGRTLKRRRYGEKPIVVAAPGGELLVRSTTTRSDVSSLEVFANVGGAVKRLAKFGSSGILGQGAQSVSTFSLNPPGTHVVFSIRTEAEIDLPAGRTVGLVYSDGRTETREDTRRKDRGQIERIYVHDLRRGTTKELSYDRPHQSTGYFTPDFQWSPDGQSFGYNSRGQAYAFVFDVEGRHLSTHRRSGPSPERVATTIPLGE